MPTIKNIGTTPKMVADRYLKPGESRDVTPKQAQLYVGDADLQISDEPKVALLKVQLVQDEQPSAISNQQLAVEGSVESSEIVQSEPESKPVRRGFKKKHAEVKAEVPVQKRRVKKGRK
jgi:hypothetical protein